MYRRSQTLDRLPADMIEEIAVRLDALGQLALKHTCSTTRQALACWAWQREEVSRLALESDRHVLAWASRLGVLRLTGYSPECWRIACSREDTDGVELLYGRAPPTKILMPASYAVLVWGFYKQITAPRDLFTSAVVRDDRVMARWVFEANPSAQMMVWAIIYSREESFCLELAGLLPEYMWEKSILDFSVKLGYAQMVRLAKRKLGRA